MVKFTKYVLCISIFTNILLVGLLVYICFYKTDIAYRAYSSFCDKNYVPVRRDNDCVNSWNNCISQLHTSVDVVFFGNSITAGNDWQNCFPDKKVINLGYIGEDVKGMLRRVCSISAVKPKQIFIMAGINGLKNQSINDFEKMYSILVDSISNSAPNASVFLESILPVTSDSDYCPNDIIIEANKRIFAIAEKRNMEYVDLYNLYSKNGVLPDKYSYDGLHLKNDAYELWIESIKKYIYNLYIE